MASASFAPKILARRRVSLSEIDAAVCARLGPTKVAGNSQPGCFNRHVAMYLARRIGRWPTTTIGAFLQWPRSLNRLLRNNDLMKRVRAAVRNRSDERGGYIFNLDGNAITLPEVAEWISMERLCCPFLTFQLSTSGNHADWLLKLSGPAGVKALLEAEFPAR